MYPARKLSASRENIYCEILLKSKIKMRKQEEKYSPVTIGSIFCSIKQIYVKLNFSQKKLEEK